MSTQTPTIPTDFIPADLDGSSWDNLAPFYDALMARDIDDAAALEQLILDRSELDATANEAHAHLYIAMSCDTEDEEKERRFLAFVEAVAPKLQKVSFDLDSKIVASPAAKQLDQTRYGVMLRDLEADVTLFREENVPLMTEDTKLGQKYAKTCGSMTVEFRGEEKTIPQMNPFFEVTDRATREEAWRLVAERRLQDAETFDDLYDSMIKVRQTIATNAGMENYRDYAFKAKHRFDYTPATCAAFHEAVEKTCIPLMRALDAERAELLGLDELRPWDLGVDVRGRDPLRPFTDVDELIAGTSRLFHQLDPSLGKLFDSMRDGTSLDLDSRKGKAPGGYQESLDRQRRPFIFMNAAGTQRDLDTMIHEAGHAFHSMMSSREPLVHYRHPPIEFAEVASMSMELFAHPYLGQFYSSDEEKRARRTHLEGVVRTLAWVATIDAFQHWVYTNPTHTRDERRDQWLALRNRFGPSVSSEGLEQFSERAWHRQLHLFEVPFYYIEYGIAQLGALQMWLQARDNESKAIENYRRAMALGGSKPLPDLFAAAELTFDFGPATVSRLMDAVADELKALPA